MSKDSWRQPTCEYIRHQKLGKYELYIYKCAGQYVLDEREGNVAGHNVSYSTRLEELLQTYNRCVREARLLLSKEK